MRRKIGQYEFNDIDRPTATLWIENLTSYNNKHFRIFFTKHGRLVNISVLPNDDWKIRIMDGDNGRKLYYKIHKELNLDGVSKFLDKLKSQDRFQITKSLGKILSEFAIKNL